MDSLKDGTSEVKAQPRKKSVWGLNLLSLLPMLFALSLSGDDPVTQLITSVSLAVSLGAAYFSVRVRLNFLGLLLLAGSLYLNTIYVSFLFGKH